MSEAKHTCGECFHFDACHRMLVDSWDYTDATANRILSEKCPCSNFIEASLVMSAFRVAERLRGGKAANMEKPRKQPPVDSGKLLIGLECCRRIDKCRRCPYGNNGVACSGESLSEDALAYIGYLEEQLEEAGKR